MVGWPADSTIGPRLYVYTVHCGHSPKQVRASANRRLIPASSFVTERLLREEKLGIDSLLKNATLRPKGKVMETIVGDNATYG